MMAMRLINLKPASSSRLLYITTCLRLEHSAFCTLGKPAKVTSQILVFPLHPGKVEFQSQKFSLAAIACQQSQRDAHFKSHDKKEEFPQQTSDSKSGVKDDSEEPPGGWTLPHPIWSEDELRDVQIVHTPPKGVVEHLAYFAVRCLRLVFDVLSRFNREPRTERIWINRICFLETVAGVPGMVAAMTRHLHSLRRMQRDHGWIHTLLEEAENERMHLMTALQLKQPGRLFRLAVLGAQGMFVTYFSFAYLISPRFCHRFVGYLEEEAVVTYTKCLKDIDSGVLQHWKTQAAPAIAVQYWRLKPTATMEDVILAIRADEAHHRTVNHKLSSIKPDDYNPYKPGE